MSDYEFLTESNIGQYLSNNPELSGRIDPEALTSVHEVGDGNLNLVFLVRDQSGRGMCLKQALPYVRMTGEGWPMTPDRARHEVESIGAYAQLVPDLVPEIYCFDKARHIIAMQDLSDHEVWRTALNRSERHEGAATAMGRFVGAVAFGTSALAMDREDLSEAIARTQNPQLCVITEDLVFTEPLVDAGRNSVLPGNEVDAAEFATDDVMMAAMGHAKWLFMTRAEALIHGDLHTGSVMVRRLDDSRSCDSVKAFDSEFAFYGPVAFDLGALFANYVIAAARAYALREDDRASWCLALVGQTWDAFDAEFRRRWPTRRDPRVFGDAFLDELLRGWQKDAWLFAAAKMSRRIIGAAKTTDIQTLPPALLEGAARGVLRTARSLVRQVSDFAPADLVRIASQSLLGARTA